MNKISNPEYYETIFNKLPDGILLLDSAFKIFDMNEAFIKITGLKKENILGQKYSELIDLNNDNSILCTEKTDIGITIDQNFAEIKDKDDHLIPVSVNHQIIDNGYHMLIISILSDVPQLDQAHIDFVSTVSHELRTPLTSIKGFADTLLTAGDKLDKDQQRKFIAIIKSQIDRLTRLVENLLTTSKIEAKKDKIIFKAINFIEFIKPIIQTLPPKTQNHIIKTDIFPNLLPIWADSDKLEQILTNLIDNAIKYSNENTTVTISANFTPHDSDFIDIKVKDHGIGIPEEHINKIFNKFSRIDNPLTRQVQGTGLGLYITKSLTNTMGGQISAHSDDKGTVFTVKLPIATPEKHAAQKLIEEKK